MSAAAPGGAGGMPGSAPSPQIDMSNPYNLSWEGDKMFNIYIYDYCFKRGYRKTAKEFLAEAEIPPDPVPPIDAKQGLLFEWWSVFWVLFTAKANGTGSDEAMVYINHQAQQAANRQRQLPAQGGPGSNPQQQQNPNPNTNAPQMVRAANGIPPGPGPQNRNFAVNGVPPPNMQNGPGSGPMLTSNSFAPHLNGIAPPPGQPGQGQPPFQQSQPGMQPGQRQQPPRPNGPSFQHSPGMDMVTQQGQNPQHPQHPPQSGMPFNRGGPGPGGTPQMGMGGGGMMPMNHTGAGGPSFQQLARPPSRTATPGQMMMALGGGGPGGIQQSPSLGPRTVPQQMMFPADGAITAELAKMPVQAMIQAKAEAGLADKDLSQMTPEEKHRLLGVHRARTQGQPGMPQQRKPGQGQPTPGPSNPMMQQPRQPPRNAKRNSTSPGEDPDMSANLPSGSSPPDRKRMRKSPMESQQQIPMAPMPGMPYPQGGGPGPAMRQGQNPNQNQNGGFPMMPMMMPMQQPQQMGVMPGRDHYRSNAPQFQMQGRGGPPMPLPMGNASSPGADPNNPTFNPSQGGGPPQFSSPGMNNMPRPPGSAGPISGKSMAPPPSPGMSKEQVNGVGKDKSDGSPHTSTMTSSGQTPTATGTAPPTPVPSGGSQQQSQPPPMQGLEPSPSLMGTGPGGGGEIFPNDFINNIASSLDDFDPSIFRNEGGDLNFERDFGQWFSPDVGNEINPLDLK